MVRVVVVCGGVAWLRGVMPSISVSSCDTTRCAADESPPPDLRPRDASPPADGRARQSAHVRIPARSEVCRAPPEACSPCSRSRASPPPVPKLASMPAAPRGARTHHRRDGRAREGDTQPHSACGGVGLRGGEGGAGGGLWGARASTSSRKTMVGDACPHPTPPLPTPPQPRHPTPRHANHATPRHPLSARPGATDATQPLGDGRPAHRPLPALWGGRPPTPGSACGPGRGRGPGRAALPIGPLMAARLSGAAELSRAATQSRGGKAATQRR